MVEALNEISGSDDKSFVQDFTLFSHLKYGQIEAVDYYATKMCEYLHERLLQTTDDIYVASTFLTTARSASHWLAYKTVEKLNYIRSANNLPSVHYLELVQQVKTPEYKDYSRLDSVAREKAQVTDTNLVMVPQITELSQLIILNDLWVTGSQYRKQFSALTNHGVSEDNIRWVYMFRLKDNANVSKDTSVEHRLNEYAFKDVTAFLIFMREELRNNNILPTKRLLLKILTMPATQGQQLIDVMSVSTKQELTFYALSENLHLNPELLSGIRLLQDI